MIEWLLGSVRSTTKLCFFAARICSRFMCLKDGNFASAFVAHSHHVFTIFPNHHNPSLFVLGKFYAFKKGVILQARNIFFKICKSKRSRSV